MSTQRLGHRHTQAGLLFIRVPEIQTWVLMFALQAPFLTEPPASPKPQHFESLEEAGAAKLEVLKEVLEDGEKGLTGKK